MKRVFFLIFLEKRAKLLAHDWLSGCLATASAIERLLLEIFCNNGVSFRDNRREKYIEELKTRAKTKTRGKARSAGRTFSKGGRMKETSKQI